MSARPSLLRLLGLVAAAATAPASAGPARATGAAPPGRAPIHDARGIVVSCWRRGYEWASPEMRALLATLPAVGADWVAIHPYAHVSRATGEVLWSPAERVDHVEKPIRWAHELGLRILVIPHLSYWGEFAWRGDVGWGDDEERWARFRGSYRDWILHLARVAAESDLFAVGNELRRTEGMEGFWRDLIRDVRGTYPGPLVYAANWDDFERVPFWDALDYIGVQAYFPLTEDRSPSAEALRRAWRDPVERMADLSRAVARPVILTEVGYTNSPRAAAAPWRDARGEGPSDVQARCLRVALEVAHRTPEIAGAFIWKWFPTTRPIGPGDFTVQTDAFKRLIAASWARGVRAGAR